MPTVAITGSSGFVGRCLANKFHETGWNIVALQRKASGIQEKIKMVPYNINQPLHEKALQGVDLLIHCAWQLYSKQCPQSDIINEQGTKELQQLAHRVGAKFIFISTVSAHPEATSHYGRTKLRTEALLDYTKDLTLKLGLVIGKEGGFFYKMAPVLKALKIIPMIGGGNQPVQTLSIDDLFNVIVKSFQIGLSGNYAVAETGSISLKKLCRLIAAKQGTRTIFLNIPYHLPFTLMSIAEKMLPFPITTENLKGLKQSVSFDTTAIQRETGVIFLSAERIIEKELGEH